MADLLDEFDNPEIPTEKKGMFEALLSALDRPSNALQGLVIDGLEGASRGWGQERNYDFEELFSDEFRRENPNASYWLSGTMNVLADPLNFVPFGMLAKGVKNTRTATGQHMSPHGYLADKLVLNEMPNRLEYFGRPFYEGGPANKFLQAGIGAGEGLLRSINRELNPFMLNKNKAAKTLGISTQTFDVVDDVLRKINNPELQRTMTNLAKMPKNKMTNKQKKMLKDYTNLGKILQGQLGWNFLEKDAYALATKLDDYKKTHFLSDALPLDSSSFVKGAKEFDVVLDDAYKLDDDVLEVVFNKILSEQKIKNPSKNRMYFKTPSVGNATATRIGQEAVQLAKKRNAAKSLFEIKEKVIDPITGKSTQKIVGYNKFDNVQDLKKALDNVEYKTTTVNTKGVKRWFKPEVRRNVDTKGVGKTEIVRDSKGNEYVMFTESYIGSDNLLGGVNQINLVSPDGKSFSFVDDAQDLFRFKIPGGQTPIVVTPPIVADFAKPRASIRKAPRGEARSTKGMMLGGKGTSPKSKPSLSPQLKEAAEAIQRIEKEITLNPLDYLGYVGKLNLVTSPYQE